MVNALLIHPHDDVVVVTAPVQPGDVINYIADGVEKQIIAVNEIPIYHKASIRDIAENALVYKYAKPIGKALCPIEKGSHVHCHNIASPSTKEDT